MHKQKASFKPPMIDVDKALRLVIKRKSFNRQLVTACILIEAANPKIGPVRENGIASALFCVFGYKSELNQEEFGFAQKAI
jgi:hypothetical protein